MITQLIIRGGALFLRRVIGPCIKVLLRVEGLIIDNPSDKPFLFADISIASFEM